MQRCMGAGSEAWIIQYKVFSKLIFFFLGPFYGILGNTDIDYVCSFTEQKLFVSVMCLTVC